MNKKLNQMKAVFMIAAVFVLAACGGKPDKKAELEKMKTEHAELGTKIKALEQELAALDTNKSTKVKDVMVTEIQPSVFRHYIDVQGMVDANEAVDIRPLMAGKVMRVMVKEGDNVSAGQTIAEIDHDVYTKQLNSLKPQIDLANELFNRQKRLWDQKIGSEIQFLQAKTTKESLEKQAETLQESIDLSLVKSPINGTVDFVGLKIGELASAQTQEPAFRVVNLSGLKVKGEIAESYASKVKKGNDVLLHFPDLNREINAKISFVEKMIDPMTRSFTTEAALTGDNSELHPNMVAVMKVIDYENSSALVIPINALQSVNDEHFVFVAVIEGNKTVAKKSVVQVGNTYDGKVEILSGLSSNDKIVTSGQLDLVDGMQIRF
jgi:membrane fusion protein (multidrug efflux system)